MLANEVFNRTKGSGAEVIKQKGGAGFAVGVAIAEVIHAMALDSRRVLPVSSLQDGCYGIRDVALSLPTVVGRGGALDVQQVELWPRELQGLRHSASVLRQTLDTVLADGKGRDGRQELEPCRNHWTRRSPASSPIPRARTSSWPTPRMPTWPSASPRRAAAPNITPRRAASARWTSIAN